MKASISLKITAFILCAVLLFTACGKVIGEEETTQIIYEPSTEAVPEGVITVPYTSLDSVNPFFSDSLLNSGIVSLVFRSLYRLDGGFTPLRDMAVNEPVAGSSVKVEIDDGLVFSDARPVSSADIVYSFELAKKSPLWKESLSQIVKCTAQDERAVLFETAAPDVNALNLLTFPIAETGTADTKEAMPIGTGYYKFEKVDVRLALTFNMRYAGASPEIGTVRLYDITDASSLIHLLDTGIIDCYFTDLADGTAKRTYSSVSDVYLNNLVFIGLNHESYRLSMTDVRRALSKALDRRAIAENAFLNNARATWVPVNMSWSAVTDSPYVSVDTSDSDLKTADALLDGADCGINGEKIYLTLICRDDNSFMKNTAELIKDELALVNIEVEVQLVTDGEFTVALDKGEYDMYLSEIKLTKNMELSPFFTAGGAASFGIDLESIDTDEVYFRYKSGEIEIEEFLTEFDRTVPFIPLVFRNGQFCYSRNLSGITDVTENDLFASIDRWKLN